MDIKLEARRIFLQLPIFKREKGLQRHLRNLIHAVMIYSSLFSLNFVTEHGAKNSRRDGKLVTSPLTLKFKRIYFENMLKL